MLCIVLPTLWNWPQTWYSKLKQVQVFLKPFRHILLTSRCSKVFLLRLRRYYCDLSKLMKWITHVQLTQDFWSSPSSQLILFLTLILLGHELSLQYPDNYMVCHLKSQSRENWGQSSYRQTNLQHSIGLVVFFSLGEFISLLASFTGGWVLGILGIWWCSCALGSQNCGLREKKFVMEKCPTSIF